MSVSYTLAVGRPRSSGVTASERKMRATETRSRVNITRDNDAEQARALALRAVRLQQVESGTQQAAVAEISKADGIPERWLTRLIRREPDVVVRLGLYQRLIASLDRLILHHESRLSEEKAELAKLRGSHVALSACPQALRAARGALEDEV